MKTVDQIRTINLWILSDEFGGPASFADYIGKDRSQVSQWLNNSIDSSSGKPRNISGASCRQIETICSKQIGWMDVSHSEHKPAPTGTQTNISQSAAKLISTISTLDKNGDNSKLFLAAETLLRAAIKNNPANTKSAMAIATMPGLIETSAIHQKSRKKSTSTEKS